jgi:hypothetical protein
MTVHDNKRTSSRTFYTNAHQWKDREEIRQACWEALYIVDPEARFRWQCQAEQLRREEDAKIAELAALDDDALIAHAKAVAQDEYDLIEGYESNFYDDGDMLYFRRENGKVFDRIDWIFIERGLDVRCDDLRPMLKEPVPNAYFPEKYPEDAADPDASAGMRP